METIEKLNQENKEYFKFKIFKKLIVIRRDSYKEMETLSQQIGKLISLSKNEENEHLFFEVYKKLCDFDGLEDELSIESFIEITTQ